MFFFQMKVCVLQPRRSSGRHYTHAHTHTQKGKIQKKYFPICQSWHSALHIFLTFSSYFSFQFKWHFLFSVIGEPRNLITDCDSKQKGLFSIIISLVFMNNLMWFKSQFLWENLSVYLYVYRAKFCDRFRIH